MPLTCPRCGKTAKTARGMRTHLMGTLAHDGHALSDTQADAVIANLPNNNGPQVPSPAPAPVTRSGDFVRDLFATLAANKGLPKYQLERRVDAILALFLPELLAAARGWRADVVVPEFPIKKPGSNQTTNADYALYRHPGEGHGAAWVLLELKTDTASVRDTQREIYRAAKQRGMAALRRDLDQVLQATTHRQKYTRLLAALDRYPVDAPIEVLYLVPGAAAPALSRHGVDTLTFEALAGVEVQTYPEAWAAFKALLLPAL